ncbi:uncharacterized protein F4807DRAFT_216771 [Annulohypoxylon truncatum]|uniref:uncharacterized protein n=1 Tax=Annulohypoxylon truncatum TaxID=327061 RepID=UPI00200798C3|nr:uncharacterized protein F4807DRAFT_216771 [Annulohypoxylon truncatum]KAI1206846.1 hypothetical protein F4807DRAFT_216771 [Annulohypoxylon truncatum]
MARTDSRFASPPFFLFSNALIWISAVIVMGILSYFISQNNYVPGRIIYEEVISVLTVAFFLISFILGTYPGYILLFNIIFSYLWLVSVVFTAEDWSYEYAGALPHCVEAFSFIAFFFLLFNVISDWHRGYGGHVRTTSAV